MRDINPTGETWLCPDLECILMSEPKLRYFEILSRATEVVKSSPGNRITLPAHFSENYLTEDNMFRIVRQHTHQVPVGTREIKQEPGLRCFECDSGFDSTDDLDVHQNMGPLAQGHFLFSLVPQNAKLLTLFLLSLFTTTKQAGLRCTQWNYVIAGQTALQLYKHGKSH